MNIKEVKFLCDTIMYPCLVLQLNENLYEITDCDDYIVIFVQTDDNGNIVAWAKDKLKELYQPVEYDWKPFNYEQDFKEWCINK